MMEETQNIDTGISLVELFQILFRNIILICIITAFAAVVGAIYTFRFVTPKYQSSGSVMVQVYRSEGDGGTNPSDFNLTDTLRTVQTVAEFLETNAVLNLVIADLSLDMSAKEIRSGLKVSYSTSSLIIKLSYENEDPQLAKVILESIIENGKDYADANYPIIKDVVKPLDVPESGTYSSPNKPLYLIISVLLGGILGVGTAFVLEAFKTTVRNKKELEALLPKYQVIGIIPIIQNGEED